MPGLFSPPVFTDKEKTRKALLCFQLIIGSIMIITLAGILEIIFVNQFWLRWFTILVTFNIICFILLFVNHKGITRLASFLYIIFLYLILLIISWTAGGIKAPVITVLPVLVLVSGILLGWKEAFVTSVITILTALGLTLSNYYHWIPVSSLPDNYFNIWIISSASILILLFLQYLSNGSLDKAVTEQKIAEEKILHSLFEKEALIREIYHRTKNTMQIIQSMLTLQSSKYPDNQELQLVVKNTENRIQAISLVHQMLYKTQNLSKISILEYIKELTRLIMKGYTDESNRITLDLEIEDQFVLIDTAIPFGLVLNELITNSLKYAFPDHKNGNIRIVFHCDDKQKCTVQYSDNGIGIPEGLDFRKQETLGSKLIFVLVESQMMGKIDFESGQGLNCRFEFHTNLYQARV